MAMSLRATTDSMDRARDPPSPHRLGHDLTVTIYIGDARERLQELPDGSVHTCISSPPYFGLRDYGTSSYVGGDPDCQHRLGNQVSDGKAPGRLESGVRPGCDASHCTVCGAERIDSQIGLEPTPEEFVAALVELFREVRRVLRDDGTLWLNLGDSYNAAGRTGHGARIGYKQNTNKASKRGADQYRPTADNLKPKDLIGIPWMVAFALRADGWYLRQDIIWHKRNGMPESVADRCTKAHEYIFLLSKQPAYYFDAGAIAEDVTCDRVRGPALHGDLMSTNGNGGLSRRAAGTKRNKRSVWSINSSGFDLELCTGCGTIYEPSTYQRLPKKDIGNDQKSPICKCGEYEKWLSHFATFPPDLIEPCILAGCPEGGTVLDPFFGAGTTGLVADRHQRNAIGCELNPNYVALTEYRLKRDGGMFIEVKRQ